MEFFLQILKVEVKWRIFSYNTGHNTKYLYFYGTNQTSKNNEIQRKSEHKIAFPVKWRKCTWDILAVKWRNVSGTYSNLNFALLFRIHWLLRNGTNTISTPGLVQYRSQPFPIFPLFPDFSLLFTVGPDFLPLFSRFLANISLSGGYSAPLPPAPCPLATPLDS